MRNVRTTSDRPYDRVSRSEGLPLRYIGLPIAWGFIWYTIGIGFELAGLPNGAEALGALGILLGLILAKKNYPDG